MFTAKWGVHEGAAYQIVTLAGAGHEARILPVNGFNLYAWTFEGREIMMQPTDIHAFGSKYGTPVLFPTPNRVKNGVYRWQGKAYDFTKRGERIVRHGLVMDEPFTVTDMGADEEKAYCAAEIAIRPGDGLYEGYPFACTLRLTWTLTAAGLRLDVQIVNDGEALMPFGFAIHPYFSKRGDANRCFIRVPAQRYYETDENLIPTGRLLPAGEGTTIHDDFHSVESLYLDTVYRGLSEDVCSQVKWDDTLLSIRASDCFRNAVVFTPHNRPGFCIEPQTCSTDFLNMHARGLADESGLISLEGGQTFRCFIEMTAQKL